MCIVISCIEGEHRTDEYVIMIPWSGFSSTIGRISVGHNFIVAFDWYLDISFVECSSELSDDEVF